MELQNINKDRKTRRKPSLDMGNMVFGKIPPQYKDLEEAILGALLLDTNCLFVGMSKLFPEIFYVDAHQRVFSAIQKLYDNNSKIDMLTVVAQLQKTEELDYVGGMYGISKLTNSVVSGANIETHILIVAQAYLKRSAIRLGGELIGEAYEDGSDAFDIINLADLGFQQIQEQVLSGMTKDISYFGMKVLEQHATTKETGVLGIQTGMNAIDKVISGLVAPDLIIIAARPSQGKTALALSITYNTSVSGNIPCAWFSLEMDGVQLVRRLASIDCQIDHERIRKGLTTNEEDLRLSESIEKIANSKIHIQDDANINIRGIRTKANLLKRKHHIKFIVVDYIQLMEGIDTKGKSREQVVSDISRGLKLLAKELQMPVIALSQLSREVEKRPSKMPQLSDLRESGAIEQDADEVIFLMRPEFYGMLESVQIGNKEYDPQGLTILSTAKNRHGETKNTALSFKGSCMHFTDHHLDTDKLYNSPPPEYKKPYNEGYTEDTPF
jgi:replicative DNA helicase